MAKSTVPVVLPGAPTTGLHATTKTYVDDQVATRAALSHSHAISDVTSLQTTLDGKETLGAASAARTAHEAASDPHPGYLTPSEGNAAYAALSHNHAASAITSGTLDIARIPTGQTGTTVPLGDDARFSDARTPTAHVHASSDVSSGTLAIARIPTGTSGTTVALGNDSRIVGAEQAANRGAASGYASLDSGTKVPIAQLPTGSSSTTVTIGNDSRLSDSRAPSGSAGGDLAGTYPNPTIKAALVDPVAGTAGLRTLGTGAQQAAAGNDSRLSDSRTPVAHNHAASDVNSGTLAIARIPTGTTSTTVALGDHTHAGGGSGGGFAAGVVPSNAGTTPSVTHALGTRDISIIVREVATDLIVDVPTVTTDDNTVTFTFGTAPTTSQYRWTALSASASVGNVAHSHAESEITGLVTDLANKQPLDGDLTTISGLTVVNDSVLQGKAGAWAVRTPAQLKTDLALVKGDVGLSNVTNNAQVTGVTAGDATITIGGTATAPTVAVAASTFQPLDTDLTTIAGLTATTDNMIQSVGSAWASRTPAQVKTALALNNLDNTSDASKPVSTAQSTALALKADLASPTFTGTVTLPRLITTPVALTDAATIAVNAALGNHFTVTLAGNRTMGAPTNPTHGQKILFQIIQDATGSRTMTWTTGAGGFIFGTDIASVTLTTTASKTDFVGAVYDSTANRWRIIAVAKGY